MTVKSNPPIQDANAGYVRDVEAGSTKVGIGDVEQLNYF